MPEWNLKNLLRERFKRFRREIPPIVLKMTSGLPYCGTEEKKFDERFNSSSILKWNISSGSYSKLFAARSKIFRLLRL